MSEEDIPKLELTPVNKILKDEECPPVSILIPCYLRRKFKPLMLCNLRMLDYPHNKLEIIILHDGPEDLFLSNDEINFWKDNLMGASFRYIYEKDTRRSIGEKRNKLVKLASHKICAQMDSDDIYLPTYIRYSVSALKEYKAGITSSASMVFIYPELDYKLTGIRCGYKHQGHEAVMVFTKKHWKQMSGFTSRGKEANQGEGSKMISYNEKRMINLDVCRLMICVAHKGEEGNTIDKDRFNNAHFEATLNGLPHLEVLKTIFNQK
jgi:hypothetical protein